MSVLESVAAWLQTYDASLIPAVDRITSEAGAEGLFKAPGDSVTTFVDGSRDIVARLEFMVRRPSQTDAMRAENQAWLEELERWVRGRMGGLPVLDGGRTCYAADIRNSFSAMQQDDAETVYQIGIEIRYFEEART